MEIYWKWIPEILDERYERLKTKYRRLEKEHNKLQVEHSRILFDMDSVIEWEVKKKYKSLIKKCMKLETRIDTMQEFIDYSEWVVHNTIKMAEEWKAEHAIEYLEDCYVIWDDKMYEAMEESEEDDSDLFD